MHELVGQLVLDRETLTRGVIKSIKNNRMEYSTIIRLAKVTASLQKHLQANASV